MGIKPWFKRAIVSGFTTLIVGIVFPGISVAAGAGAPPSRRKRPWSNLGDSVCLYASLYRDFPTSRPAFLA